MGNDRLAGRAALITGSADGIGRGMARRFAGEGAKVIVADFNESKGEETAQQLRQGGAQARFVCCDVTRREDVLNAVEACVAQFGTIDILVNNAYRALDKPVRRIENKSDEIFENALTICLYAAKWSMQAAFPHMRARGFGRVINLCSLNGVNAHMGTADYNVSKEALRTYTRSAAREWARYGICANVICPAAASSSFQQFRVLQPGIAASSEAANPMGRMGDPELDIGGVAVFLASEDARYLTGNTLFVDGGAHINGVAWAPDLED